MAVSITIATGDDVAALHAALQHLVPQLSSTSPPPGVAQVESLLAHEAVTQFLARTEEGSIVGVATLCTFPTPGTILRAWVEDVIVDEAWANQGIGRRLLEAMVARAAEAGAATVDLTSRPARETANHLYRSAGFETRDTNVYRRIP